LVEALTADLVGPFVPDDHVWYADHDKIDVALDRAEKTVPGPA
jgi:hypothetical protein